MASPPLISNLTPLDDTVRSPLVPQRPAVAAQPPANKELPRSSSEQSGFHTTAAGLIEVGEFVHDPELEEAAIRFANGDPLAAEAGLMELLRAGAAREMHEETWLTLFDLYRAAGMQNQYDQASMEFVGRFQRSAPQWFSMPQRYGSPEASPAAAPVAVQKNAHWSCAPLLNAKGLQLLQDSLAKAERPWRLDWSRLSTIDPDAADAQWAQNTLQPRSAAAQEKAGTTRARPAPPPAEATPQRDVADTSASPMSAGGTSLLQARTVNEVLKAKLNNLELAHRKKELVDRAQAVAHVFKLARIERDAWLNWPARISGQMASALGVDAHTMHVTLEAAVREHLIELGELRPRVD